MPQSTDAPAFCRLKLNAATYRNVGGNFGSGNTGTLAPPSNLFGLDRTDSKVPQTNNYTLSIAQQLPKQAIVQASYVGNNSNSLMNNGTTQAVVLNNVNALPVGRLFTPAAAAAVNAWGANACNPTAVLRRRPSASMDSR